MKAVLFDLFGTLVDNFTNESVVGLHRDMAAALEVDVEELRQGWKATFHERQIGKYKSVGELIVAAASHCSATYNPKGLDHAVQIRYDFSRRWLEPRPDAISTLRELRLRGFTTGLLSNCSEEIPEL
jgi:putative hydrolase of the HAD superfamily